MENNDFAQARPPRDVQTLHELVRETREFMIRIDAKLDAYMERREADDARLLAVEAFCEEKRKQISELRPLLPAVFGTGAHDPGLTNRVSSLENRAVTWRAVAAISASAGALGGILFEVFGAHPKG